MIHDGCGSCSPRGERPRLRSLHQELKWEEFTKVDFERKSYQKLPVQMHSGNSEQCTM